MKNYRLHVMIASALLLSGCSIWPFSHKTDAYKSAQPGAQLEIPPDLTHPALSDRYVVPQAAGSANQQQEAPLAVSKTHEAVLPQYQSVRMEEGSGERWLVVDDVPEAVWPMVKAFWVNEGYPIKSEDAKTAIIKTDWKEYHPEVDSSGMHGYLHKHLGMNYSTGVRDQFTTRLERAGKTTRIYVSMKSMQQTEKATEFSGETSSLWVPAKYDPELQAEVLSKLMVSIGSTEKAAKQPAPVAAAPAAAPEDTAISTEPTHAKLSEQDNDITLDIPADRAWRRVGLALEKIGFTVDDKDRNKGVYFVTYTDPEAKKEDTGFLSNLEFWKDKKQAAPQKYQIQVQSSGEGSLVSVLDSDGFHVHTDTSAKILRMLIEQLQ